MLWLALRFASLPLEVYARAAPANVPLAVVATSGSRSQVIGCNGAAAKRGIKAGMPPGAASALCSELQIVPRASAAEEAALERIAAWAIQFTPAVSISKPDEVLLEIGGSLALFNGLKRLWNEVEQGLSALGYAASMACAPTPLGAQWFARAGFAVRLSHPDALRVSLPDLPIEVMHAPHDAVSLLQNVGARTLHDVMALPRDGLARRLGQALLDDFDRALGNLPDPRRFFAPPSVFKAEQALPAPAQEAEMLLFAARRMLVEFCGYLAATANGAQRICFSFEHQRREPTQLTLSLVAATRDADHLTNVLRERLERTALPCPALSITLTGDLLLPLASRNLSFLPETRQDDEAASQLIERLRARLGDDAVLGLKRFPDHRPERAWRTCTPGGREAAAVSAAGLGSEDVPATIDRKSRSGEAPAQAARGPRTQTPAAVKKKRSMMASLASRPLLLLAEPRALVEVAEAPCYEGRLSLLAGPERIESGWWDGNDIARDYFVASNPAEAMLWIYRERSTRGRWFLHGFFA